MNTTNTVISVPINEVYCNRYHEFTAGDIAPTITQINLSSLDKESVERVEEYKADIERHGQIKPFGARPLPDRDGYELIGGHHHCLAMRELDFKEVQLFVEELTDEVAHQRCIADNDSYPRNEAKRAVHIVKRALEAFCKGELPEAKATAGDRTDRLRFAPLICVGACIDPRTGEPDRTHPYTATSLAKALNRVKKDGGNWKPNAQIMAGLEALEAMERGAFTNQTDWSFNDGSGKSNSVTALWKAARDVNKRFDQRDARMEEDRKEQQRIHLESLRLQKERKDKQNRLKEERDAEVRALAKAKAEKNTLKAEAIKARIKEQEDHAVEKALDLEVRAAELDKKVEARKAQEVAQRKVDAYLPVQQEVDRICHALEGGYAMTDTALFEAIKALVRYDLRPSDRERLRQTAMNRGNWFLDTVAVQFLPPFSTKQKLSEYRSREATARRAALAVGRKRADSK